MTDQDTGDLAAAPESAWNATDRGEGSNALYGATGSDDDLADVYANPGPVIDGSLA